ncbi:MAG: PilW family protein [Marinagarivorans sp.]|nr:PilW family protein [Marinagarivorans sp.]
MMRRTQGFSLIELMISMVVSMIILSGVMQVLLKSKQNALEQFQINDIQDNARFVMHVLTQDLLMAGYWGCATTDNADIANAIGIPNDADGFISLTPLTGFEGEGGISDFPTDLQARAIAGSDAFIIRRADNAQALMVKEHKPSVSKIELWDVQHFAVGDTLVIADSSCRQVGVFQMSGPSGSGATYINNAADALGNCTNNLQGNFVCSSACTSGGCPNSSNLPYSPGSSVMRFNANAYYIGLSPVYGGTELDDMPILFKQELNAGAIKTKALAIAQGIENMDIIYGVDLNSNGEVDRFLRADQMDLDGNGSVDSDEWKSVIAVRISLVLRSHETVFSDNQAVTLQGKAYNDRYLRQAFSQTIKLRNHG